MGLLYFRELILILLVFRLVGSVFSNHYQRNKTNLFQRDAHNVQDLVRPSYYDWRLYGKVSPVKNQGRCGACWAFSVVANIESHRRIYVQDNQALSEQFLIDCLKDSAGCTTASVVKTFAKLVEIGGLLFEKDYFPFAEAKLKCRWNSSNTLVPVTGFKRVYPEENIMLQYVYNHGPLVAAINSNSMKSYTGGIDEPSNENCPPMELDHTVLIVGYSTYVSEDKSKVLPYWIIKNSWGTEWGDRGYYYLVRGRNACGIASDVSFAYVN